MKTVVMALSGGMDSTCLLIHYLSRNTVPYAFHTTTDKNMRSNLNERLLQFISVNQKDWMQHHIVDLSPAMSLLIQHLLPKDRRP